MKTRIEHNKKEYEVDLSKPLDISISLRGDASNVSAWYMDHPKIAPHREGEFVGAVSKGAAVNFNNIWFSPHAHGTHTECVGHITGDFHSVNKNLNRYFFLAELITVAPGKVGTDFVISKKQLENALRHTPCDAIVIRTLPNTDAKITRCHSHTNPPYLLEEAASYLRDIGVRQLLIDLPSVDKEKDEGALLAHKAFWNLEGEIRYKAMITEFIYVPNTIMDGLYFLNLQVAPFENDASPSRPVLYKIKIP
ncbi:cyclase family protein [Maribacter sp. 2304DJ31-5]|uniref:cyclase family protein n=1 Tax=Maribacter sp. 2304DJ31-5 TaxID=3386273 RepID=UPI0039BD8AE6